MDYTKRKKAVIKKIKNSCEEWLEKVDMIGNECAWTDRTLEEIVSLANKLEGIQEEEIENWG